MQTQLSKSNEQTRYSPPDINQLAAEAERLYQFYVIPSDAELLVGDAPKRLSRVEENLWLNFARKQLYKAFLKERQQ